jgi:hypothetical protein
MPGNWHIISFRSPRRFESPQIIGLILTVTIIF